MDEAASTYRILTIDGGGIIGTYPAAFLTGLEQHLSQPIGKYFDLIAGTSTGGIIAIGLAMGKSAKDILHLYETRGPAIFDQHHRPLVNWILGNARWLKKWYQRKYGSEELRKALEDIFGDHRIGEARTRLLVPAWNPALRKVHIYKTAHHERLRTDYRDKVVDAALARYVGCANLLLGTHN